MCDKFNDQSSNRGRVGFIRLSVARDHSPVARIRIAAMRLRCLANANQTALILYGLEYSEKILFKICLHSSDTESRGKEPGGGDDACGAGTFISRMVQQRHRRPLMLSAHVPTDHL